MKYIKEDDVETTQSFVSQFAFRGYSDLVDCRTRVDDCLQGQKNIKRKMIYLPPTKWQTEHKDEYYAFLQRALFYSMTMYAMRIYEGLTMAGTPVIDLPEDGRMDFLRQWATVHKRDLHALQSHLNTEQFSHGLRCMLVEPQGNKERPFFIQEFCANSFLRAYFENSDGHESSAKMILVDQSRYVFNPVTKMDVWVAQFLVLGIDADGYYYQSLIPCSDWPTFDIDHPPVGDNTKYPVYRGKKLTKIPFTWCGSSSLSGIALDMPPLIDMADCEIKLFQLDAQYSQHIFQSCQETVFFLNTGKGFNLDEIRYGSGAHNKLPKDVDVKVVSNNGVGFNAQREYMDSIIAQIELRRMSIMSSKSHQSGTAVGIVQKAQTSPLRTIVDTSGDAITEQLRYIAEWMGYDNEEIKRVRYVPSMDFARIDTNLSEFVSLCMSVMSGDIPMLESDLYRLAKENGYVNSKLSWDEFKKKWELEKLDRQENLGFIPQSGTNNLFKGNSDVNVDDNRNGLDEDSNTDDAKNKSARRNKMKSMAANQ